MKLFSPAEADAAMAALEAKMVASATRPTHQAKPPHGEPFAKRPEGRARRAERRDAFARKHGYLNSAV